MSEPARIDEGGIGELMSGVDVVTRRLGPSGPARWQGAAVDVLTSLPDVAHSQVALLWAPGSSTFATAVAYANSPQGNHLRARLAAYPAGIQLLIKRARELGADAIVIHEAGPDLPKYFGIH